MRKETFHKVEPIANAVRRSMPGALDVLVGRTFVLVKMPDGWMRHRLSPESRKVVRRYLETGKIGPGSITLLPPNGRVAPPETLH